MKWIFEGWDKTKKGPWIEMMVSGCPAQSCPEYQIWVHSTGMAAFNGVDQVKKRGHSHGKIDPGEWGAIEKVYRLENLKSWKPVVRTFKPFQGIYDTDSVKKPFVRITYGDGLHAFQKFQIHDGRDLEENFSKLEGRVAFVGIQRPWIR